MDAPSPIIPGVPRMLLALSGSLLLAIASPASAQIPEAEWVNLTQDPEWDRWPSWSPDQSSIAFVRSNGEGMTLMVMASDGSGLRRLTDGTSYLFYPTWFPESDRVAYDVQGEGIFQVPVEGGSARSLFLPAGHSFSTPALSPDGLRIAYAAIPPEEGSSELFVSDLDGSNTVRLTHHQYQDNNPTWAPDGSAIAFESQRRPPVSSGVYVVNIDGSGLRRVSPDTMTAGQPAWSPDGSRIAFCSPISRPDLYVIDVDGTDLIRITDYQRPLESPAWSPDGRKLAFVAYPGIGYPDIWVLDVTYILGLETANDSAVVGTSWGQLKLRLAPDQNDPQP